MGTSTASRALRVEAVGVSVSTLTIGPSVLPETTASTSPLLEGQYAAADSAGVEGAGASAAQEPGLSAVSVVGAAVGVATSVVLSDAFPLSTFVFVRRYVTDGGVLIVLASVEFATVA